MIDTAGTSYQYVESTAVLTNDQWQHIVFTYDHNEYSFYRNGVPVGSGSYSGNLPETIYDQYKPGSFINQFTLIGDDWDFDYGYTGRLDDLMVLSTVLDATEVLDLYTTLPDIPEENLTKIGTYYNSNESPLQILLPLKRDVEDISAYNRTMILNGSQDNFSNREGYSFNGVEYIEFKNSILDPNEYIFSPNKDIKISFWTRFDGSNDEIAFGVKDSLNNKLFSVGVNTFGKWDLAIEDETMALGANVYTETGKWVFIELIIDHDEDTGFGNASLFVDGNLSRSHNYFEFNADDLPYIGALRNFDDSAINHYSGIIREFQVLFDDTTKTTNPTFDQNKIIGLKVISMYKSL